jgi:hypothetical protein
MTTRRLARTELARLQHEGNIAGLPEVDPESDVIPSSAIGPQNL